MKTSKKYKSKLKNRAKRLERKLQTLVLNAPKVEHSNDLWWKWQCNYFRWLNLFN